MFLAGSIRVSMSRVNASGAVVDDEPARFRQPVAVRPQRRAVERHRHQRQFLAVEFERRFRVRPLGVAPDAEPRLDPRRPILEREHQLDRVDQKLRRPVIRKPHRPRRSNLRRNIEHRTLPRSCSGTPAYPAAAPLNIPGAINQIPAGGRIADPGHLPGGPWRDHGLVFTIPRLRIPPNPTKTIV